MNNVKIHDSTHTLTLMSNSSHPYADVSEFALAGEARELATRILWDLINPCRQRLANAERARDLATNEAQQALAAAEAKLKSTIEGHRGQYRGVQSRVDSGVSALDQICGTATAHLRSENVTAPTPASPTAGPSAPTGQPDVDMDSVLEAIEPRKTELQVLCQKKKPAYWPKNSGGRWVIVCTEVILLFTYPILMLVWPLLVCVARLFTAAAIKSDYQHLLERSHRIRLALEEFERRAKQDLEAAIKAAEDRLLPPARRDYSSAVEAANTTFGSELQRIRDDSLETSRRLHAQLRDLEKRSLYAGNEWLSADWEKWFPDPSPEFAARIGAFAIGAEDLSARLTGVDFNFRLPALIPFDTGRCLLLEATGAAKEIAAKALQSVMLRMMANTPPGKLRFTFIDPVGLGQNVADYMALADHEESLISGKAWTESRHIEARLAELSDHMETVIQKYLRNDFASITDYNRKAQDVAEPFRFLVVFDFPVNFSDEAARRLVSIVKNGPRCGVFTSILRDTAKPLPYGFNVEDLNVAGTRISFTGKQSTARKQEKHAGLSPAVGVHGPQVAHNPTQGTTLPGTRFSAQAPAGQPLVEQRRHLLKMLTRWVDLRQENETVPRCCSSETNEAISTTGAPSHPSHITFDILLESVPLEKKEAVARTVCQFNTAVSFEQAVAAVSNYPKPAITRVDWSVAETARKKLEDMGAKAQIKVKMPRGEANRQPDAGVGLTGCFVWNDKDFQDCALDLDEPPPKALFKFIVAESGTEAKEKMKVEVPFEKLLLLADLDESKWWQGSTAASVRVPLGPSGARKLQHLVLGEGLGHHGLIVGRPGSGKSNLMHVIITTLALSYTPEEMQLYLIDFKKGVEFKPYADHKLPHALAIAVESEREFGFSVIERLDLELKERGDRFRSAGSANILEYRQKRPNERVPRVLLLIDEFQELFVEEDNLARQSALLLDRLVRQGRAFGLHVILGSQTLGSSHNMPRSTLDQMAIRIAMQCTEADSRLILADDNPAARLLSRPGEAIYNASTGTVEGNNLFQVALFQEEDREKWLGTISELARRRGGTVPTPIIFEGNELARAENCRPLQELISSADWPERAKSVDLFLGEPIAIRPPVVARVRRQSGSHLAILTRDESEGTGMCVTALLSLLLQHRPGQARIIIADFTTADSEWAEHAEEIERSFPGDIKVVRRQREVPAMLASVAEEIHSRGEDSPRRPEIYVVLQGMHRIKALREDEADEDGKNAVELLGSILRDGPEVGVHVIAWADTWANATRGLGRKRFSEFGLRVGATMSAEESMNFLDGPAASRLSKPHRAIFSDEDRPGQLVAFRPYAMPCAAKLKEIGQTLKARA